MWHGIAQVLQTARKALQRKFIAIKKIRAVAKALESCASSKWTVRDGYIPEQKAEIGEYAVENGATNAAKCYSTVCSLT